MDALAPIVDLDDYRVTRAGGGWVTGWEQCAARGHRAVGVAPTTADLDHLECARCHAMVSVLTPESVPEAV